MAQENGQRQSEEAWSCVNAFAKLCKDVGAFGFGHGWDGKVAELLEQVPLEQLLAMLAECSAAEDLEWVEDICVVLKHTLRNPQATGAILDEKFLPALQGGLAHYSSKVRALTMRQLRSIGLSSFAAANAVGFGKLVGSVAERLFDAETGVATDAESALVWFANEGDESNRTIVLTNLAKVLADDDKHINGDNCCDISTAKVRVMSSVARVSAFNLAALTQARDMGLTQKLLAMVAGDDVLLQLNVLRLIPLLSNTKAGLDMLVDAGIVKQLAQMAGLDAAKGADPLLGEEALKVISQLSARTLTAKSPESARDLSELFLQAMELRLAEGNASGSKAIATLSLMGSFAGAQPPSSMAMIAERKSVFQAWISLAAASPTEAMTVAGLGSIADALRGGAMLARNGEALVYQSSDGSEYAALLAQSSVRSSAEERAAASEYGQILLVAYANVLNQRTRAFPFAALTSASDAVNVVIKLLDKPFDKTKCAVYALLQAVAAQDSKWGINAIYGAGYEFEQKLMDRSLTMNKQAKEWRFAVLEAVFNNPHRDEVLGTQRLELLKSFLRRGAYAGPSTVPVPQVMLEGAPC